MKRSILVVCALLGCSDDPASPQDRAVRLGVYSYQSQLGTGTLRVTTATADTIAGVWTVPGFDATAYGHWIDGGDSFALTHTTTTLINGTPVKSASYAHYVTRSAAGMNCNYSAFNTSATFLPCTLSYVGP